MDTIKICDKCGQELNDTAEPCSKCGSFICWNCWETEEECPICGNTEMDDIFKDYCLALAEEGKR